MGTGVQPADLAFFSALVAAGSLSRAARELGITTAAVSKRLSLMETRLGVVLVIRTTRRMSLTPEGELFLQRARAILTEIDELDQQLNRTKLVPQGLLRVNATLGFGRRNIAPIISRFVRKYPEVEVQLQLSVNPPLLADDECDICIRFGPPPEARVIARKLAANRRLLCAAPAYLERFGSPEKPQDLVNHNCISIRQGNDPPGLWRLVPARGRNRQAEVVKVRGNLVTNDGEIAVNWALDGHGILVRAEWDIERHLGSGRLVRVLPQYETPESDIYASYPERLRHSPRLDAFLEFIAQSLQQR